MEEGLNEDLLIVDCTHICVLSLGVNVEDSGFSIVFKDALDFGGSIPRGKELERAYNS